MPPNPIQMGAYAIDLAQRFALSTTVAASPSGASETIIASVTIPNFGALQITQGVIVYGWAAYTIGATPTSCQLRIRQTNVAGTVKGDTGAMTGGHNTAAFLVADDVNGFDSGAGVATYVLTLTVAGGSSASTVSAVFLQATAT